MNKQKSQEGSVHLTITIVLIVTLLGILGFVYWRNFMQPKVNNTKVSSKTVTLATKTSAANTPTKADLTAGWQTYTVTSDHLSFKYPQGTSVLNRTPNGKDFSFLNVLKTENINSDGSIKTGSSRVQLERQPTDPGALDTKVVINSPSGPINATYAISPKQAYVYETFYTYEFQKNGKFYVFSMDNYDSSPEFLTPEQFKTMVDSITFS